MLVNIFPADELHGLARRRKRTHEFKSVRHPLVQEEVDKGWAVVRKSRTTTRLSKPKTHDVLLEDRVWTVLYRMGFTHLSGAGGAELVLAPDDPDSPKSQIDVVAVDDEVALAVECKSAKALRKSADFAEDLAKHATLRGNFIKAIHQQLPADQKRQIVISMFTANINLTENDRVRAEEAKVPLFDENDLAYYESLVSQIGLAGRFQFLADLLPGKQIPGLSLVIPSVRTRMGGYTCYTFGVSPEYLLKIAYVSHRAKGKASDVDTYQRMLKKSRLRSIREYISNKGIFPTNIVINIPNKWLSFQRARQEAEDRSATFGWLQLRPAYKAAWIIDGQHRLYGYAGHPLAAKSVVSVLAFADLPASEQARLFVDINAEQRKVKQSLLQELYAELHWDAEDPQVRARAILSKAIQALDTQQGSPFYGRILKADESHSAMRCISITSLFRALDKPGFFIARTKEGHVLEYGPLWAGENERTLRRTIALMGGWFEIIRGQASSIWDVGSGEGGGVAMNDGVTVCINVLRSVFDHLRSRGVVVGELDEAELVEAVKPFGVTLGRYFATMNPDHMKLFRALRGVQGQTTGTRRCQAAIQQEHQEFQPLGLREFLEREKAQTNKKAYEVITSIELMLQSAVLSELKLEHGSDEAGWWYGGIPTAVRKKVSERVEDDQGKRGGREVYFDLIDYRDIVTYKANWPLFEELLGVGKGSKEARTSWIAEVNEIRKTAMHASRGAHLPVTEEQLAFLEEKDEWLRSQVRGGE